MLIRMIREDDAEQFLQMRKQVITESPFMLREPDEWNLTVEDVRENILAHLAHGNQAVFVAEDDGKLVGFLSAEGSNFRRIRHTVYIVVGILQAYTGRGIGTQLFIELERWARQKQMTRLELTVMVNNPAGIALYKKRGFEIEGIKRRSIIVDGQYIDEYYMSKLLE